MTTFIPALVFLAALWLSYANGANDNLKGVATLLGSGTASYRRALAWGTSTTLAGSLCALLLSGGLVAAFSGKGVVQDSLIGDPAFVCAVGFSAAFVVMAATVLGLPISTTHALVGSLAGAAAATTGFGTVGWDRLGSAFALPLLASPICATALVAAAYPLLRSARLALRVEHDTCLCVVTDGGLVRAAAPGNRFVQLQVGPSSPTAVVAPREVCIASYRGRLFGMQAGTALDGMHYLSAGAVSFARGVNDTPKIAALMLGSAIVSPPVAMAAIGSGMAAGAILNARRVAKTMSFDITTMNSGQGFTANLTTAALVLGASRFGLPVSTTHVSVGSLIGLGLANKGARGKTIRKILLAWLAVLPAGFGVGWTLQHLIR